ncbi:hypothetical protein [Paenibacillus sp. FSL H7-0331]|nr:hypothetical protein [Paenibacillus sp. FSL H7-0331]
MQSIHELAMLWKRTLRCAGRSINGWSLYNYMIKGSVMYNESQ